MNRAADSSEGKARLAAFQRRLKELGWSDGQNLHMEIRWDAEEPETARKGAVELAALAPDVVLASGTLSVKAMLRASRAIPVVFAGVADPVGLGVVASLAHPGGNATGFSSYEYSFAGKLLEVLKEIAPRISRAAILRDADAPQGIAMFAVIQSAAAAIGVQVSPVDLRDSADIERAVAAFARSGDGGLVVTPSGVATSRSPVVALAARHKLPAVYGYRQLALEGGLISYGPDWPDQYRRAAEYIDRILKGEKPADLPVQAPTKYELVVNLKTAKTLGLTVPDSLLARADEVIE
ncbi:MAG TPA: ABC transporter substrate-binding protein [Stellaceae bacterium]|nr:ABC transporter substrate-binding protein [Stellaceae bacterium]